MNAAYRQSISTTAKTLFQAANYADHDTPSESGGFDIDTCTQLIIYNHDAAIDLLVKCDGHHDEVEHAPPGYGTVVAAASQWVPVLPGGFLILNVAKDNPQANIAIRKVQAKSASGTIDISWGVLQRR